MSVSVEDVKALIRSKIERRRERHAAMRPLCGFESEAAEMRALRRWSDIHTHNQVLRRLLDEIEKMEGQG